MCNYVFVIRKFIIIYCYFSLFLTHLTNIVNNHHRLAFLSMIIDLIAIIRNLIIISHGSYLIYCILISFCRFYLLIHLCCLSPHFALHNSTFVQKSEQLRVTPLLMHCPYWHISLFAGPRPLRSKSLWSSNCCNCYCCCDYHYHHYYYY